MTLRFNEPAGADEEFRVANLAGVLGIEIHDIHDGLYEISYQGFVDKATLLLLVECRSQLALRDLAGKPSDSEQPDRSRYRTTNSVM